jgi:polyisoprenoid-binding protein YceI
VIVIDPPHPTAAHIDVDIDASSVDTAMAVRDDHLRSEEFFDVERHPKISFRSEGAMVLTAGLHGERRVDDPWHHPNGSARR